MINRFLTRITITAGCALLLAQSALPMQSERDGMKTPPPTLEQRTVAAGKFNEEPFALYRNFLASLGVKGTSLTPAEVSQLFQAMLRSQKNVK